MTKPINGLGKRQKQFISALRSGDYEKVDGALRDSDGNFCTLGVACQVAVDSGGIKGLKPNKVKERITVDGHEYELVDKYDTEKEGFVDEYGESYNSTIPECVVDYYGFYGNDGQTQYGDGLTLMELNDDTPLSLEQIADLITGNPRNYFYATL